MESKNNLQNYLFMKLTYNEKLAKKHLKNYRQNFNRRFNRFIKKLVMEENKKVMEERIMNIEDFAKTIKQLIKEGWIKK